MRRGLARDGDCGRRSLPPLSGDLPTDACPANDVVLRATQSIILNCAEARTHDLACLDAMPMVD
jgi:hypothetical protein